MQLCGHHGLSPCTNVCPSSPFVCGDFRHCEVLLLYLVERVHVVKFLDCHHHVKMHYSIVSPYVFVSYRHQATQNLVAQLVFSTPSLASAFHVYNPDSGKKESLDSLLMGPECDHWLQAASNEFGRLSQGNKYGVTATDTIDFIPQSAVPSDRKVTYGSFVCDYRPLKEDPYRVHLVVGGDKLEYNDDPASPAAGLLETKLLIN